MGKVTSVGDATVEGAGASKATSPSGAEATTEASSAGADAKGIGAANAGGAVQADGAAAGAEGASAGLGKVTAVDDTAVSGQ